MFLLFDGISKFNTSEFLVALSGNLVDVDKLIMGYLYEAMDSAKESICAYHEDKGDEGYEK